MHSDGELVRALSAFRLAVLDQMQAGLSEIGLDLSLPQSVALTQIAARGPVTIGALAANLKRSQATTSHLVSQLELRGLVERNQDAADGRRTVVLLSKLGRRLMARLERLRQDALRRTLSDVPQAVRKQLKEALWATLEALQQKP